jgi:hypothetical protein
MSGAIASLLGRQQRVEWQAIQSRIRDLGEPVRFAIDLLLVPQALNHPRFGAGALRRLTARYRSARAGGDRECHGCCQRWTRERTFGAVGIIEFLNMEGAGLVGLRSERWARADRLQIVIRGFRRDFGPAPAELAHVHGGSRA